MELAEGNVCNAICLFSVVYRWCLLSLTFPLMEGWKTANFLLMYFKSSRKYSACQSVEILIPFPEFILCLLCRLKAYSFFIGLYYFQIIFVLFENKLDILVPIFVEVFS